MDFKSLHYILVRTVCADLLANKLGNEPILSDVFSLYTQTKQIPAFTPGSCDSTSRGGIVENLVSHQRSTLYQYINDYTCPAAHINAMLIKQRVFDYLYKARCFA